MGISVPTPSVELDCPDSQRLLTTKIPLSTSGRARLILSLGMVWAQHVGHGREGVRLRRRGRQTAAQPAQELQSPFLTAGLGQLRSSLNESLESPEVHGHHRCDVGEEGGILGIEGFVAPGDVQRADRFLARDQRSVHHADQTELGESLRLIVDAETVGDRPSTHLCLPDRPDPTPLCRATAKTHRHGSGRPGQGQHLEARVAVVVGGQQADAGSIGDKQIGKPGGDRPVQAHLVVGP